jgi:hypothetical protein
VVDEVWFWDGDLSSVLSCVSGDEEKWLVEKGVLQTEDDDRDGVKDLLKGDIVYRIRTVNALERALDPREQLFDWVYFNPLTGEETERPSWREEFGYDA